MRTISRAHSLVVFPCPHVPYNSLVTRTVLHTRLAGVLTKQLSVLPLSEKHVSHNCLTLSLSTRVPHRGAPRMGWTGPTARAGRSLDQEPRRLCSGKHQLCPGRDEQLLRSRVPETRTLDRVFQSTSQEESRPSWRPRRPRVRMPRAMMCHKGQARRGSPRQTPSPGSGQSTGRPVLVLLSAIRADSSLTDPSRPEGAGPEAPGRRGTFRVTDTTPERALRCGLSFAVW